MLLLPAFYKRYDRTPLDSVYRALRSKDLSDCVVNALDVLKKTNHYMDVEFKLKSSSEALEHGIEGKRAFFQGQYQKALVKYNMALMRAPLKSEAMRLTYYSRAELLLETKQFSSCIQDIETCLTLNCPDKMVDQLQKMKEKASEFKYLEKNEHEQTQSPFTDKFFKLKDHNPDIPCVSSDVEVIMESQQPKIVAAKDIPVGSVLAIETSFVSATDVTNHITSCHYCHKMSFNLMPCEECCSALFCDTHCKELSMREGHKVECKIMDIIMLLDIDLCVKAVIKMRQKCDSWDELISASNNLGVDRMTNSSIADIFGSHNFSILNSNNNTHFIYGAMFNKCLYFANIIHYLDERTSFLPNLPDQKNAAIRAVSRIMMHLTLFGTPVQLQHYSFAVTEDQNILHNHPNRGYFSFSGNLRHSCLPNTYMLGIRNSVVLVALMPIKQGTELSVSYSGHWLEKEEDLSKKHVHYYYLGEGGRGNERP